MAPTLTLTRMALPAVFLVLGACLASTPERLTCDDVLPPGQASYSELAGLIGEMTEKGCAFSSCHGGSAQQHGLRLDSPSLVFDALSTRADLMYAMLASGQMPAQATRWDETNLRLFRSWYCDGGLPR